MGLFLIKQFTVTSFPKTVFKISMISNVQPVTGPPQAVTILSSKIAIPESPLINPNPLVSLKNLTVPLLLEVISSASWSPSSPLMKPKPLLVLKNFTVPLLRVVGESVVAFVSVLSCAKVDGVGRKQISKQPNPAIAIRFIFESCFNGSVLLVSLTQYAKGVPTVKSGVAAGNGPVSISICEHCLNLQQNLPEGEGIRFNCQ